MNSSYKTEAPLRGIISIEFGVDEIAQEVNKKIEHTRKTITMPGFRKGKVPKSLVEKRFGEGLRHEVAFDKAQEEMSRLYKEHDIKAITMPVNEVTRMGEEGTYEFNYHFPLTPDMSVAIDETIELPYYTVSVSEEDIDEADKRLRSGFSTEVEADTMEPGDFVTGKLQQLDESGEPVEGGLVVERATLVPAYFRDKDEQQKFDGVKKGDSIRFNPARALDNNSAMLKRTFELDSNEEALTYTGDFLFDVETILHAQPAELGEEFYQKAFGKETSIKDEEAYRKELRKNLEDSHAKEAKSFFRMQLIQLLVERAGRPELDTETIKRVIARNAEEQDDKKSLTEIELSNEVDRFVNYIYYSEMIKQLIDKLGIKHSSEEIEAQLRSNFIDDLRRYGYNPQGMEPLIEQMVQQQKQDEEKLYQAVSMLNENAIASYALEHITRREETVTPKDFAAKVEEEQKRQMNLPETSGEASEGDIEA